MLTILLVVIAFFGGFIAGRASTLTVSESSSLPEIKLDPNKSYWKIVRYHKGTKDFDCIWENGIYDKRVADKRCARLNDPKQGNEHYYGDYYVEKM